MSKTATAAAPVPFVPPVPVAQSVPTQSLAGALVGFIRSDAQIAIGQAKRSGWGLGDNRDNVSIKDMRLTTAPDGVLVVYEEHPRPGRALGENQPVKLKKAWIPASSLRDTVLAE